VQTDRQTYRLDDDVCDIRPPCFLFSSPRVSLSSPAVWKLHNLIWFSLPGSQRFSTVEPPLSLYSHKLFKFHLVHPLAVVFYRVDNQKNMPPMTISHLDITSYQPCPILRIPQVNIQYCCSNPEEMAILTFYAVTVRLFKQSGSSVKLVIR
jgi:hypothetical protein